MKLLIESLSFISIYSYKLISWFEEQMSNYKRYRDVAKTVEELNKLSDSELTDIGLTRGGIYEVAYNSFPKNSKAKGWV